MSLVNHPSVWLLLLTYASLFFVPCTYFNYVKFFSCSWVFVQCKYPISSVNRLMSGNDSLMSNFLSFRSLDGHNTVKTRPYFEDEQHTVTCLKFIIRCNTKVFCEWCVELLMLCALQAQHSVWGSQIQYKPDAWANDCFTSQIHVQRISAVWKLKDRNSTSNPNWKLRIHSSDDRNKTAEHTRVFWIAHPTSYLCECVHEGPAKHKESQVDGIILYYIKQRKNMSLTE